MRQTNDIFLKMSVFYVHHLIFLMSYKIYASLSNKQVLLYSLELRTVEELFTQLKILMLTIRHISVL